MANLKITFEGLFAVPQDYLDYEASLSDIANLDGGVVPPSLDSYIRNLFKDAGIVTIDECSYDGEAEITSIEFHV